MNSTAGFVASTLVALLGTGVALGLMIRLDGKRGAPWSVTVPVLLVGLLGVVGMVASA